ncbi:unnamed protein product [Dibothriocephalus latus]|uniref:Uncharacterized protein n=1 Tax=Dibothriocephalus latus TaxID=60516 RepID=A0A3P7NX31_DIBLA|nr:unnamed protein product [Dibothriocephalus latus]
MTDSRLLSLDDLRDFSSPRARGTTSVHWKHFGRSRDSSPSLFTSGFQDLSTRHYSPPDTWTLDKVSATFTAGPSLSTFSVFPEGQGTEATPLSITLPSQPRASSARLPITASLGLQIPISSSPTRRRERQRPALGRFIDLDFSPNNLPGLTPPSLRSSDTFPSPLLLRRSFTAARKFPSTSEDPGLRRHTSLRRDTGLNTSLPDTLPHLT